MKNVTEPYADIPHHRGRINTEEKSKVVATDWGTEFIQVLATL